ncbi:MAG: mechanosensitive ion channel family protein [Micavibrio sp.]|nr:mechanosensitive ion channel family protein [Micavibrio sp.]|tara:strand:+ start:466 stop:1749 length:1284 start_codon:yes stop_codon:yes gene_type:complete
MFEEEILKFIQNAISWLNGNVLTPQTGIEFIIIFIAFGLGLLGKKILTPILLRLINQANLPWRFEHILKSITGLTPHMIMAVLLAFTIPIATISPFTFATIWITAATKLLMAWIFIRIAAQLIANTFLRKILTSAAWIIAALSILGILDNTISAMDGLGFKIGDFRLSVLSIFQSIISVVLFVSAAFFLSSFLDKRLQKTTDISVTARVLISKVIKFALISIAVLIGITSAGIDLSVLAVFGGALGIGIGFGLQKGVSNLFSGILLLLDRSIKPGDVIQLQNGEAFGWVEHMGARYTNIVTRDNISYLVPNEDLITQQVVNWSHGNTLVRMQIVFGVHYDSDPHFIKKIAIEAAQKAKRVVEEPLPVCHLIEFGDSSIKFTLRFWIKDAEKGVTNVKGDVFLALWDALKENNIKIPYPHREVFVHNS